MNRILKRSLRVVIKTIVRALAWALFSLKVEGRRNIPKEAPFIIVSNHSSFLDPGVIQSAIPRDISWIAKRDVYETKFLKSLCNLFDIIVINGTIEKALSALKEGRVLGIFPEGTRTRDGTLKEGNIGVAILALKSGASLLPIGIKGSFEAYPPGKSFFSLHPVTVKIGRPFSFEKIYADIIEESILIEKRDYIMDRIRELLG